MTAREFEPWGYLSKTNDIDSKRLEDPAKHAIQQKVYQETALFALTGLFQTALKVQGLQFGPSRYGAW